MSIVLHLILNDSNTTGDGEIPKIERSDGIDRNGNEINTVLKTVQVLQSSNITSIPKYAFNYCTSLRSVYIEDGAAITSIGRSAFSHCTSLKEIVIPNGVTTIEEYAFRACTLLKEIEIPNGVRTIKWFAFSHCTSLKLVVIPNGVTTIEGFAFNRCTSLQSVVIPNGMTTIEHNAFNDCTSLQLIEIPDSISEIGPYSFNNCDILNQRLTNGINYHDDTHTWLCQRFDNLPIHRACYRANNTEPSFNALSTLIQQNAETLADTDAMGMAPLHILCCKTNTTDEIMQLVAEADPSVLIQTDVTESTPLQLFLKCRNLQEAGQETISILQHLLDLLSQIENTSLLPYMTAAMLSECGLDVVFCLAMNSNLGSIS